MVNKVHILSEIRRTAVANGGVALGQARFETETGIGQRDWRGIHWARWSDAVEEAGLEPNQFKGATEEKRLLDSYARYAQVLGKLPTKAELQLKRRGDSSFPSWNTFARFGSKLELVKCLREHCKADPELATAGLLCDAYLESSATHVNGEEPADSDEIVFGFVYLAKSGKHYKIGKSYSPGRRQYELSIQLPEPIESVHVIRTDDPSGIEEYWYRRFADKRLNGEWFALDAADVAAFKRRKFM